jgi:hypothetical protein
LPKSVTVFRSLSSRPSVLEPLFLAFFAMVYLLYKTLILVI